MINEFEYTEGMNEISGYGGDYERACRAGVRAGACWFADHLGAKPEFASWLASNGRVMPVNMEAHGLLSAMEDTDFTREDGTHVPLIDEMTGEMTQIMLYHVLYIAKHGWNKYAEKMTATATPTPIPAETCQQ